MIFDRPELLWLVLLAPGIALVGEWVRRRTWRALAAWSPPGSWRRLIPRLSRPRVVASYLLLAVTLLALALALARPRWGAQEVIAPRRGIDVIYILDTSLSMACADVQPDRLTVARGLATRLSTALVGHRQGLVQAEGDGVVLVPLTLDPGLLGLLLETIQVASLPVPGTDLAPALSHALQLFPSGSDHQRAVVLLTDGEDHGDRLGRLAAQLPSDVHIFALGIGTLEGGQVPATGTGEGVKLDESGEPVVSRLREDALRRLAEVSGGRYQRVDRADVELGELITAIRTLGDRPLEDEVLEATAERFQWPLALGLLCLLLHLGVARGGTARARRPRTSAAAIGLLALLVTLSAQGQSATRSVTDNLSRWWTNPRHLTQQAVAAEVRGDLEAAADAAAQALAQAPEDPRLLYNAGSAALGAGRPQATVLLERAAALLEERTPPADRDGDAAQLAADAWFNAGNAHLASGNPAAAIAAFESCLRRDPAHRAAKLNLEWALRQLPPPPSSDPPSTLPSEDPETEPQDDGTDDEEDSGDEGEGGEGSETSEPLSERQLEALLRAVEALERQHLQAPPPEAVDTGNARGKDW